MRLLSLCSSICLWLAVCLPTAAQVTPNGAQIYAEHCARCHETSLPRMPTREQLRGYSPENIENALSSFAMRAEAEALTPAERRAVTEYVAGLPAGSYKAPLELIPASAYCSKNTNVRNPLLGNSWNGWGAGLGNARYQDAEAAGLTAADVPRLTLKWAFGIPGAASSGSQVTIIGQRVFVGSRSGMVYSLDADTGCIVWAFEADAGVRSTPTVVQQDERSIVYFGDAHAQVYALDALTGVVVWKNKLDEHAAAMITGGAVYYDGQLYVPVSSLEEGTASTPTYECCTFRGSLVALDAASGSVVWQTHTIARGAEPTGRSSVGTQTWGPSGAAIWSAPTIDAERKRIYVTTGDNYSNPPVATSDAVMALELDTGRVLWSQQTLPGDAWNVSCMAGEDGSFNCPDDQGPDHDFGSSPVLAEMANGRSILLAGQKSGVLFGLNPDDGRLLWERRVAEGGVLGGIEWGFATDGDAAFVSLSDALEKPPGESGGISAVDIRDGTIRWTAPPAQDSCANRIACTTAQPGAVTAIPGVAFSGSLDGHIRAYDTRSGAVLWDFDTVRDYTTVNGVPASGGSLNGPGATVAGGMVFVSSGYAALGFMPGNVLLAFGSE